MELLDDNSILSSSEIDSLFDNNAEETAESEESTSSEKNNDDDAENDKGKQSKSTAEVDADKLFDGPESVGSGDDTGDEDPDSGKEGSSAYIYSSIAKALKEEGVFPDLDDDVADKIAKPEDFANVIEQQIQARFDERQRRIDAALNSGMDSSEVKRYEDTLAFLNGITDKALSDDSNKGENLRKQLIYQDYINRGFSKERAQREVQKSFDNNTDIEDAQEALSSNKDYFNLEYKKALKIREQEEEDYRKYVDKQTQELKDSIVGDTKFFGDSLNKDDRVRIYEAITKPVWKDPDTGDLLTAIQKYEKDNRNDFLKYLGYFFTMTKGFKDFNGIVSGKVKQGVRKGLKELEATLNNTQRDSGGGLQFMSGNRDKESFWSKYDLDV